MKRLKALFEQLSFVFDAGAPQPGVTIAPADQRARRLVVGTGVIHYRLRRARRRSIGFQIDDDGLTVSAPRWVAVREIEAAIADKAKWIRAKQVEWQQWRERNPAVPASFADGASLPFLGVELRIRLRAEIETARLDALSGELLIGLHPEASEAEIRNAARAWLQAEAQRIIGERIERLAPRVGGRFSKWTLTSARTQWGSCTHDGRVRLNWRLVHFSLPVIDYVVAHELAHLYELNHGARFWRRVGELLPGFEEARDQIKGVDMQTLPL